MVVCSSMESIVVPRPPAPPLGPLVPTGYPFKGRPLSPPPAPCKPPNSLIELQENNHHTQDSETGDQKIYEGQTVIEERRITQKMVEKNITRNESVRSKMSSRSVTSQRSNGFRLIDNTNGMNHLHNNSANDDAGSVRSIYKQRIDSMFESDSSTNTNNHNSVQAKIEKMFSDVAKDGGIPTNQIGVHAFSVDYLGSIPLQDKVTSLAGLQKPLRDLYFSYKKITKSKKVLSGRLEISSQGLRVQYQGPSGDLEQMNSFPSIAVWSAVKFVIQENSSMLHGKGLAYAFLPLITDPDNMDKQMLFKSLEEGEKKYITSEQHSPLFAVVMRKIGVQKQLECHGFVCQTSEDAIVIAATLYKSLVNHMKNKERRPKNKNGVTTCMSTASSTMVDKNGMTPVRPPRRKRSSAASSVASDTNSVTNVQFRVPFTPNSPMESPVVSTLSSDLVIPQVLDGPINDKQVSETQPLLPTKPPKKSTKHKKAPKAPEGKQGDVDAILPYEEPITLPSQENTLENKNENEQDKEFKPKTFSDKISTYMSEEQKKITAEIKQVVSDTNRGLKRVQSVRKRNEESVRKMENSGDIFTKVTIPRSGSFLNTGGLTRYKNKTSRNNESASGGSPLGFKEIFHELSIQEGLHSMDDILSVIIDPNGMSFNDLKPIYKEFLLKLAVTLTKDELYLKSKSIMRRQRKKIVKRSLSTKRSSNILVSRKFKRLKHIFQKTLASSPSSKLLEDTNKKIIEIQQAHKTNEFKLPESSISTSSYDTRPFRTKDELVGKKTSYRKKTHGDFNKNRRRDRTSTSEESDFFSLKRHSKYNKSQNMNLLAMNQNRNSSSGYVSCSECSYDSDTCTCVSADKCYCSLGHRNFGSNRRDSIQEKCACSEDPSLTYCECDTDSCAESNKCYCQNGSQQRKAKQSRNGHTHHTNCNKASRSERHQHRKLCKNNSNSKSSRSLEYMSNPSEGYYEKLRSKQKYGSERVQSHYASRQSLQRKRRNSHTGVGMTPPSEDFNMISLQNMEMGIAGGNLSAMDYEFLKLARRGGFGDLAELQEVMSQSGFRENVKDYWNATRSNSGLQKFQSAITTGACSEALSVKKSAEIAALFADIKLSQTTDITHLAPAAFDVDRRNKYNIQNSLQAKYSKPNKTASVRSDSSKSTAYHKQPLPPSSFSRPSSGLAKNKSKLYSAKNGLYTIQSQSDESRHSGSRRSSISEGRKLTGGDLERYGSRRNVSSNIENSLGYLP